MLCALPSQAAQDEAYQAVVEEVARGVRAVSGLQAEAATQGWLAIECQSEMMAGWLSEAIIGENVEARATGKSLLLPISAEFTVENEIKSLITVVAKTTDYWFNHMPTEVKQALAAQAALEKWKQRLTGWFRR